MKEEIKELALNYFKRKYDFAEYDSKLTKLNNSLIELKGSEKQVLWAKDIRKKEINYFITTEIDEDIRSLIAYQENLNTLKKEKTIEYRKNTIKELEDKINRKIDEFSKRLEETRSWIWINN